MRLRSKPSLRAISKIPTCAYSSRPCSSHQMWANGDLGTICFCDLGAHAGEQRMRYTQMEIFDDLHVVTGDDNACVTKAPHLPARKSSQPDSRRANILGCPQSVQHVGRIATSTDSKRNISGSRKVCQLLRKNVFVLRVVRPGSHQRHVVGQRQDTKSLL